MLQKKKVLHIVEAMGGGIFTYIVELANGISEDYDVTIAFGIRHETPSDYQTYFNDKVKLVKVENFVKQISPVKDLKASLEIRKMIKDSKPDIVHLHSSKAGALGRLLFISSKYKMFYTPHGYSFLMEDVTSVQKKIFKFIEKFLGKRNCTTIACGRGEYEESKKVSTQNTYVMNGINTEKLDEIMAMPYVKGSDHPFTVYTVGRVCYQKNPEMFNKIATLVPDVKFVWIGEGDMESSLTADNISVTGWLKGEETLEFAKNGDLFILPSRWEGLPISLLEAMYMKKLCIVSDVVGNRDIIIDGKTGYICRTAEDFAEAIRKARAASEAKAGDYSEESASCDVVEKAGDDAAENSRIIENAHDVVVNFYNSKMLCEKYKEIYRGNE